MNKKAPQKLCWNCEGNVSFNDSSCPYCGVSMDVSPLVGTGKSGVAKNEEMGALQYNLAPPYKMSSTKIEIPETPFLKEDAKETATPIPSTGIGKLILTVTSLMLGLGLVLFSFLLFFFSDSNEIFTLRWHASYWFVYLFIGIPLLYAGWKLSHHLQPL